MNKQVLEAMEQIMQVYVHLLKKGYTTEEIKGFFYVFYGVGRTETETVLGGLGLC